MHKLSVNTLPQYQLEMTLTVMTARLLLKPRSVLALAPIAEKFLKFVRCNANADVDDAVDHSSKTERLKSVFQGKLQFLLRLFLILS